MKFVYVFILVLVMPFFTKSQEKISLPKENDLKTIGLIGGTSWHSTVEYYAYINQKINDAYHNNTNPPMVLINLNQHYIHELQKADRWDSIAEILTNSCNTLSKAGVQAVMFCANTPHKVYDDVQAKCPVPILHIADATGWAINEKKIKKVGLIGTRFTMKEDFISNRLYGKYNVDVIVPEDEKVINKLQEIIEKELSLGILKPETKQYILEVISNLINRGAEGIILGCTEFPLIIEQKDVSVPIFNTTLLHAQLGADFVLGNVKY